MLYNNLAVNEKGHLTVGGLDTVDLAEQFGAPLYVLDEDRVRANCRTYVRALSEYMPAGSYPLFAGKALCFKGLYPVLEQEGMGADVVSPGEIYTALAGGFPAERLYFHGNNKTDEDIAYALESGVGWNTPGIIKYSFWDLAYHNDKAVYACLNVEEAPVPREIRDRAIVIGGDSAEAIRALLS